MKILFTGASSFTGYWFVQALKMAGHDIAAPLLRSNANYSGNRLKRVEGLSSFAKLYFEAPFGSPAFLELIEKEGPWDLFCHHGAYVENYKSDQFDYTFALSQNTHNMSACLQALKRNGCKRCLLTGSLFEADEGQGQKIKEAFSPYGLSKGLTYQIFRFGCSQAGLKLSKFVIPNPFGPLEEERFTSYLIKCWVKGQAANVNTPLYIRDNIPVSLLALAYADYAASSHSLKFSPSGYRESQQQFSLRFAKEMRPRLDLPCKLSFANQTVFTEPKKRIGLHPVLNKYEWNENKAWEELASWYQSEFKGNKQ